MTPSSSLLRKLVGRGASRFAGANASRRGGASRRAGARGFTIPELLAVVIIIGIFAATASPMFIEVMRDRRVNRAAMEISGFYRLGRSRALGRGTAVLVRWAVGAPSQFEVWEAKVTSQNGSVISGSCLSTDWAALGEVQKITSLPMGVSPYELAQVEFLDEGGATQTLAEMCFTARGRTFVRYTAGSPFTPLTGVPRINVRNGKTQLLRTVLVPPNGAARMAL